MPMTRSPFWQSAAPLALLTVGLPVWWVLGIQAFLPLALAAGMAWYLMRRDTRVHVPPAAAWWLLFLVWVVLGCALLWSDAPGAVDGGGGPGRPIVYGYRLAWYLACTIVLLWVGNSSRARLPDRTVHGLIGVLFVVAAAGGLLGLAVPQLEFRSALESVLPGGLRANSFVSSLVHVEVADVQYVLGHPSPRPKAPFAFTNTWGSVLALSVVFLVVRAIRSGARTRLAVAGVIAVALVPVVHSLNRGLWVCLGLGALGAVVLAVRRMRADRAVLLVAGAAVAVVMVALSPLSNVVSERLDNQHSNDRRGQLLEATVSAVSEGSPVAGFGTTRDVEGSFASIAGGATPDCPACGVPPLGTQGHLWLVLFSQGWLGLAFFLTFLMSWLWRSWRCRTLNETVATFVLVFFAIQLFVYDTLGLPLMLVMVAIGLVWREQREAATTPRTTAQLLARGRQVVPVAVTLAVVGATLGWFLTPGGDDVDHVSEARIALTPVPVYLAAGLGTAEEAGPIAGARDITIDTEAALVLSERTLQPVAVQQAANGGPDTDDLREALQVTAVPNTDLLVVRFRAADPAVAQQGAEEVADSYLASRQAYLERRRQSLVSELRGVLKELPTGDPAAIRVSEQLNVAINRLLADKQSVGRLVRVVPASAESPDRAVTTVSGLGLGLLVGVALALAARLRPVREEVTTARRPRPRWGRPVLTHPQYW
ncbi:hypothetical protein KUV85_00610 [Nocardioides panacisoli]|uniref:hypothetical protein n=1 Tax=Nocardioides panacisoli TaxID=627624 RepID=UPI001C625A67|nr:hypothetical protein [Nocardioides panacisoli]QYJ04215.1 hypothetical protein KUV85_00610 [Nocardioides panacisoli]